MLGAGKLLLIVLPATIPIGIAGALLSSAPPERLQILGYSGHLGEWELRADLVRNGTGRELSGPLTMEHVGMCSQSGPEVRTGVMRVSMARFSSGIDAKILIDGIECRYSGIPSESYTGAMTCPDRRPVPLKLWTK